MDCLVIDPHEPDVVSIDRAAAIVRGGGVVAYPTETVYGLAVDPRSDAAVRRLFAVKDRDPASPIALIAADLDQAEQACRLGAMERRLAASFWPGPLTIVMPASPVVSPLLGSSAGTLGVRVPAHRVARELARAFGGCITATSANLAGQPAAATGAEVAAALGGRIDLLIDGGPAPGGPPSTVVEVVRGVATLHRAGAIAWDRVLKSLE